LSEYSDIDLSEFFHNGKINFVNKPINFKTVHELSNWVSLLLEFPSIQAELSEGKVSDGNMVLHSLFFTKKNQGQTKESISKTIAKLEARLKVLIIENEEFQSVKGVKGELQVKSISENLEIKRGGRDRLGVVE